MRARFRLAIACAALGGILVLGVAFADRCPEGLASTRNFAANARVLGAHYLSRRDAAYRLEGRELYLENCSVCHAVPPAAVDLADASVGQQSDLALFRRIRGGESPTMPPFGDLLSPSQTLRVVAYLRSALARGASPSKPMATEPLPDGSYKVLVVDGGLRIYSLDAGYAEVRQVRIPGLIDPRGCGASAATGRLYVSYRKDLDSPEIREQGVGWLSAIDLASWQVIWTRSYAPSIDSFALTPDGRTLYMPSGERRGDGQWRVIDARQGDVVGEIPFGQGPHNTVMGPTGERVYLAALGSNTLGVADARYPSLRPKWINVSRDGRYVHVSTGAVIAAETRQVVRRVAPTKHFLEVEYRAGTPIAAYSRYGNGYVKQPRTGGGSGFSSPRGR